MATMATDMVMVMVMVMATTVMDMGIGRVMDIGMAMGTGGMAVTAAGGRANGTTMESAHAGG